MNFKAVMFADNEPQGGFQAFNGNNPVDVEVEFTNVKEVKYDQQFFVVIKENGEQFAVRTHMVKKYQLTNN